MSGEHGKQKLSWGPIAVGGLLLANVVVPLVWGDVYPFTSGPMFRDSPRQCCNYRVLAPDGTELPPEDWLCHRLYDGNPLGYGVGLCPPPVIEQEFSQIHTEEQIREHIQRLLERPEHANLSEIHVVQERIGPLSAKSEQVGIITRRVIVIRRP